MSVLGIVHHPDNASGDEVVDKEPVGRNGGEVSHCRFLGLPEHMSPSLQICLFGGPVQRVVFGVYKTCQIVIRAGSHQVEHIGRVGVVE